MGSDVVRLLEVISSQLRVGPCARREPANSIKF